MSKHNSGQACFLQGSGCQSELLLLLLSLEELLLEELLGSLLPVVFPDLEIAPVQALARSGSATSTAAGACAARCLAEETGPVLALAVEEEDVPVPLGSFKLACLQAGARAVAASFPPDLALALAWEGSAVAFALGSAVSFRSARGAGCLALLLAACRPPAFARGSSSSAAPAASRICWSASAVPNKARSQRILQGSAVRAVWCCQATHSMCLAALSSPPYFIKLRLAKCCPAKVTAQVLCGPLYTLYELLGKYLSRSCEVLLRECVTNPKQQRSYKASN